MDGKYAYVVSGLDPGLAIYPAQCETPVPVLITGLEAAAVGEGVLVRWQAHEEVFEGFDVLRAAGTDPQEDDYRLLNPERRVPGEGPWEYLDRGVTPGQTYGYMIAGHFRDGDVEIFGPVFATAAPMGRATLQPAWPNPSRGGTTLSFDLPRPGPAEVRIYDLAGREVRRLLSGWSLAGRNIAPWDGRSDSGQRVASGTYLIRLTWDGGSTPQCNRPPVSAATGPV